MQGIFRNKIMNSLAVLGKKTFLRVYRFAGIAAMAAKFRPSRRVCRANSYATGRILHRSTPIRRCPREEFPLTRVLNEGGRGTFDRRVTHGPTTDREATDNPFPEERINRVPLESLTSRQEAGAPSAPFLRRASYREHGEDSPSR